MLDWRDLKTGGTADKDSLMFLRMRCYVLVFDDVKNVGGEAA